MTIQASAYVTVNPSFIEPEFLIQYSQASGFLSTLAGEELRPRLAEDDLIVYMKQVNLRTKMTAGTASANELPGVDISLSQISTGTYLLKCRSEYDHHDVAAGGRWGISTVEAYRLGMRQANFQLARDATLVGINPQNGEGLLNVRIVEFVGANIVVFVLVDGAFVERQIFVLRRQPWRALRGLADTAQIEPRFRAGRMQAAEDFDVRGGLGIPGTGIPGILEKYVVGLLVRLPYRGQHVVGIAEFARGDGRIRLAALRRRGFPVEADELLPGETIGVGLPGQRNVIGDIGSQGGRDKAIAGTAASGGGRRGGGTLGMNGGDGEQCGKSGGGLGTQ